MSVFEEKHSNKKKCHRYIVSCIMQQASVFSRLSMKHTHLIYKKRIVKKLVWISQDETLSCDILLTWTDAKRCSAMSHDDDDDDDDDRELIEIKSQRKGATTYLAIGRRVVRE